MTANTLDRCVTDSDYPRFAIKGSQTHMHSIHPEKAAIGCELVRPGSPLPPGEHTYELAKFLGDDDDPLEGATMAERSQAMDGVQGQEAAEEMYMNRDNIPGGWQMLNLIFPDTEWHDRDGNRFVPRLYFHSQWREWKFDFFWLGNAFNQHFRVVRLRTR